MKHPIPKKFKALHLLAVLTMFYLGFVIAVDFFGNSSYDLYYKGYFPNPFEATYVLFLRMGHTIAAVFSWIVFPVTYAVLVEKYREKRGKK